MREIRFRAWSKKFGLIPNDRLCIEFEFGEAFSVADEWKTLKDGGYEATLNFTLEQYTGLKDKNGVEIYEGDIVKSPHWNGEIKFVDNIADYVGYYIMEIDEYGLSPQMFESNDVIHFEVIGNIHSCENTNNANAIEED